MMMFGLAASASQIDTEKVKSSAWKKIALGGVMVVFFMFGLPMLLSTQDPNDVAAWNAGTAFDAEIPIIGSIPVIGHVANMFLWFPRMGFNMCKNLVTGDVMTGARIMSTGTKIGAGMGIASLLKEAKAGQEDDYDEKDEGILMFGANMLKTIFAKITGYCPPLWFVFGRPNPDNMLTSRLFAIGPMETLDNFMASVHPLWTIPEKPDPDMPKLNMMEYMQLQVTDPEKAEEMKAKYDADLKAYQEKKAAEKAAANGDPLPQTESTPEGEPKPEGETGEAPKVDEDGRRLTSDNVKKEGDKKEGETDADKSEVEKDAVDENTEVVVQKGGADNTKKIGFILLIVGAIVLAYFVMNDDKKEEPTMPTPEGENMV